MFWVVLAAEIDETEIAAPAKRIKLEGGWSTAPETALPLSEAPTAVQLVRIACHAALEGPADVAVALTQLVAVFQHLTWCCNAPASIVKQGKIIAFSIHKKHWSLMWIYDHSFGQYGGVHCCILLLGCCRFTCDMSDLHRNHPLRTCAMRWKQSS